MERWAGLGAGGCGNLSKKVADLVQGSQMGRASMLLRPEHEAPEKEFGFRIL